MNGVRPISWQAVLTARAAARTTSRPWSGSGSRSMITRSGRARWSTVEVQAWNVTVARLAR
jgi:hypothetical protein